MIAEKFLSDTLSGQFFWILSKFEKLTIDILSN